MYILATNLITLPGSVWRLPAIFVHTCPLVLPSTLQPKRPVTAFLLQLMHVCASVVTLPSVDLGLKLFDQDLAQGTDPLTGQGHVV